MRPGSASIAIRLAGVCLAGMLLAGLSSCNGFAWSSDTSSTTSFATVAVPGTGSLPSSTDLGPSASAPPAFSGGRAAVDQAGDVQKGGDATTGDESSDAIDLRSAALAADGDRLIIHVTTRQTLPAALPGGPHPSSPAGLLERLTISVVMEPGRGDRLTLEAALNDTWTVALRVGDTVTPVPVAPTVSGTALTMFVSLDELPGLTPDFRWRVIATSILAGATDIYVDQIPGWRVAVGDWETFEGAPLTK